MSVFHQYTRKIRRTLIMILIKQDVYFLMIYGYSELYCTELKGQLKGFLQSLPNIIYIYIYI